MLKVLPNFEINTLPFINPLIFYEINNIGALYGINIFSKRKNPVVVSIFSECENFKELQITLYSILNQSLKPDRIVLWLDKDTEDLSLVPYTITQYIKNGLEIKFVKNLASYTKTIYALKDFKDSIIVTAEDNIYYEKDWLKQLYHSYIANPEDIHVHLALNIDMSNSTILPFENWKTTKIETSSYKNFPIGASGILYPPDCFTGEVFREDIFLKQVINSSDMWFWLMALIHNRKIRIVKNHYSKLLYINYLKYLKIKNEKTYYKKQNIQLANLMKYYGQNIITQLKKA